MNIENVKKHQLQDNIKFISTKITDIAWIQFSNKN